MGFAVKRRGPHGPRRMTPTSKAFLSGGGSHRASGPAGNAAFRVGLFLRPGAPPMSVITVSREYGAGGGEVARRLAEALGWELLDRELLHRAAAVEQVPDADLERLDEKAIG